MTLRSAALAALVVSICATAHAASKPSLKEGCVGWRPDCPEWRDVRKDFGPGDWDAAREKAEKACGKGMTTVVDYNASLGAVVVADTGVRMQYGRFAILYKDGTYIPLAFYDPSNGQQISNFRVSPSALKNTVARGGGLRVIKDRWRYSKEHNHGDRFDSDRLGYYDSDSVLRIWGDTDRSFAERNMLCPCGQECRGSGGGGDRTEHKPPKKDPDYDKGRIKACLAKKVFYYSSTLGSGGTERRGIPGLQVYDCRDGKYVVLRLNTCKKIYGLGLGTIEGGQDAVMKYKWTYDNEQKACSTDKSVIANDLKPPIKWIRGYSEIPMSFDKTTKRYVMNDGRFTHCYTAYNTDPSDASNPIQAPGGEAFTPFDAKSRLGDMTWDAGKKAYCNTQTIKGGTPMKESTSR